MTLKDVRYIFQIPLDWFKRVDARVFGDHPGSGVKFENANDGSRAVMIDFDVLDARYSGGGSGYSETVTVVTGVTWNGTVLSYSSANLAYSNGKLMGVTANAETPIDRPVQYEES